MEASHFRVRGVVQGVGFRPFVARLAAAHHLMGWVRNADHGVEIHVEGAGNAIAAFSRALATQAPPAARVEAVDCRRVAPTGFETFLIRDSQRLDTPTARISPDLPVCSECVREMFDPAARRFEYPYINCTNCGPRYSIVRALPYDRERTTMAAWSLCCECHREYADPLNRRFHAEPVACPRCGPEYRLVAQGTEERGRSAIVRAAHMLRDGALVAIKGIGGYHLCCDATNRLALRQLRERKYRKSRPFAIMVRDVGVARRLVTLGGEAEALLTSSARPIVLLPALVALPDVAPMHRELGVMIPYAPIHHLLFAAGAPDVLVMTSANRSSEPIAFEDADALARLAAIADAFLVGDRPIARRVDDSVVRPGSQGPVMLRRGRGHAPGIVGRLPTTRPILAVGADLKNTITLVVGGAALTSQHLGDLGNASAYAAFQSAIRDLIEMYDLRWDAVLVAHDAHPHYASTAYARDLPGEKHVAVQHHRAHVASVLAERGALETRVIGVAFDGTGYGDDETVWGGEFFAGSVVDGLSRVASLRPFPLPGGDAAARWPVQAAAGVLYGLDALPEFSAPPFCFPKRYGHARKLIDSGLRTFTASSSGRVFDAAAAVLGFTREIEYEAQAAVWLEQLAWRAGACDAMPFALTDVHLDFRATLHAMIQGRLRGDGEAVLARAFHESVAAGLAAMISRLCEAHGSDTVVLSGGVFQNALLVDRLRARLPRSLHVWTNLHVPANDGGISLGQAAFGCLERQ